MKCFEKMTGNHINISQKVAIMNTGKYINRTAKIACIILLALIFTIMFVSCSAVNTALHAIGRFFVFVFWLLLAIIGIVVWIWLSYEYVDGDEFEGEDWPLYVGFLAFCVGFFSITRLLGGAPIWLMVIGIAAQITLLIVLLVDNSEEIAINNSPYVWFVSFGIIGSLVYIFGLMNRTLEIQNYTITLRPIYCIIASGVLALIPACLPLIVNKIKLDKIRRIAEAQARKEAACSGDTGNHCIVCSHSHSIDDANYYWCKKFKLSVNVSKNENIVEKNEAERRRKEEIERNRPIAEKLAELSSRYAFISRKNKEKINLAEQEFSQLEAQYGKSPVEMYKKYLGNKDADNVFNSNFKEDLSGKNVNGAKKRYEELAEIVKYYAVWYQVQMANAEFEKKRYNYYRKKAVLFVKRIDEIWDQLTKKQKERKITDVETDFHINIDDINNKITQEKFKMPQIYFSGEGLEALSFNFNTLGDIIENVYYSPISNRGEVALLATGVAALASLCSFVKEMIDAIKDNYERKKELKRKIEKEINKLHKIILNINENRLKAMAFCKRADEINALLEKFMSVFEINFVKVFNIIYPAGDISKSKEARIENKQNGGSYFSDEEASAVWQLRSYEKYLVNIVDTEI